MVTLRVHCKSSAPTRVTSPGLRPWSLQTKGLAHRVRQLKRHEEVRCTLRKSRASPAKPWDSALLSHRFVNLVWTARSTTWALTLHRWPSTLWHTSSEDGGELWRIVDGAGANPRPNPNGRLLRTSEQQALQGELKAPLEHEKLLADPQERKYRNFPRTCWCPSLHVKVFRQVSTSGL